MGVSVNGTDLADLGIGMTRVTGWADGPDVSRDSTPTTGLFGPVEGTQKSAAARSLRIDGMIKDTTVAGRKAVLDEVAARCRDRTEIIPDDDTSKVAVGYLERTQVTALEDLLTFDLSIVRVRLDFVCYEGMYRDLNAQVASFDSTARDVAMGSGPHRGVITIAGEPTDPTLTVRDFRGAVVATMEFTGTLAADEAWIVDLYEHTITLSDSGVESAADDVLAGGAFFHFEAAWANPTDGSWPTLEIDDGSGSITYYRRWLT